MDVSVIVLAYGEEEWLSECITAVLASEGVALEVIVVDNGAVPSAIASIAHLDDLIRLVSPGSNLGFAGGVNLGVEHSCGDVVCLVNSDARVAPDCIALLVDEVRRRDGIAGGLVLLADEPETINSAGNPLHILGLSWAGGLGQPRAAAREGAPAVSASGACLALTRELWNRLHGFSEEYFAYLEDMDLSWRTHQLGLPVSVLPDAVCWHHYEYGRTGIKNYLLERNRLMFLLTNFEAPTLAALALPLFALEGAMLVLATAQGWAPQKLKGWGWLLRNTKGIAALRRRVQAERIVPDADLVGLLTPTFTAQQESMPQAARSLEGLLRAYWRFARRVIERRGRAPRTRKTQA